MKTIKIYFIALMVLPLAITNLYGQDTRPAKERWSQVTMKGTVTEIVKETRDITLMGSNGDLVTITADESMERFDEVAVGDVISFDYLTYTMVEFREPTAEELAEPVVVVAEAGKAPEDMAPAGAVGAIVRAIVTIEVLNRPFMQATVRGPGGNYVTIDMEDAELIKELNIGQVVILTYAEAIVMSLTKED